MVGAEGLFLMCCSFGKVGSGAVARPGASGGGPSYQLMDPSPMRGGRRARGSWSRPHPMYISCPCLPCRLYLCFPLSSRFRPLCLLSLSLRSPSFLPHLSTRFALISPICLSSHLSSPPFLSPFFLQCFPSLFLTLFSDAFFPPSSPISSHSFSFPGRLPGNGGKKHL